MAHNILTPTGRGKLAVRVHEPYWRTLERGKAIGYRKTGADTGLWIARLRPSDGATKYEYEPLGNGIDYSEAESRARKWFADKAAGLKSGDVVTVADACRAYVEERRRSKSEACAHDAEVRFERTVYGREEGERERVKEKVRAIEPNPIARIPLAKLRAPRIREWRDGLDLKPAAANRTLVALKAALNLAVHDRHASAELTVELRRVKPLPGAKRRRDLYLDIKQRRALLKAAKGAVRDLIEAVILTGARAGELTQATVGQFDARTKSMTFTSGKGNEGPRSRTVPLSPAAVKLFSRLAKDKARGDRLFLRDDDKTPWAHSDWDSLVRDAAVAAKLPAERHTGVCLYSCRHSFITQALTGGMATLEVARLVGTSVMMIERHYGHLAAKAARARLAKVAMV